MTELNKFGAIGQLLFHKKILPSRTAEFVFQNFSIFSKIPFFVSEKKNDTKSDDKESVLLLLYKNSEFLSLIIGVLGRGLCTGAEGSERAINKWN